MAAAHCFQNHRKEIKLWVIFPPFCAKIRWKYADIRAKLRTKNIEVHFVHVLNNNKKAEIGKSWKLLNLTHFYWFWKRKKSVAFAPKSFNHPQVFLIGFDSVKISWNVWKRTEFFPQIVENWNLLGVNKFKVDSDAQQSLLNLKSITKKCNKSPFSMLPATNE